MQLVKQYYDATQDSVRFALESFDTLSLRKLLAHWVCENFWHIESAKTFGTLSLRKLLAHGVCEHFWHIESAKTFGTWNTRVCENFWHMESANTFDTLSLRTLLAHGTLVSANTFDTWSTRSRTLLTHEVCEHFWHMDQLLPRKLLTHGSPAPRKRLTHGALAPRKHLTHGICENIWHTDTSSLRQLLIHVLYEHLWHMESANTFDPCSLLTHVVCEQNEGRGAALKHIIIPVNPIYHTALHSLPALRLRSSLHMHLWSFASHLRYCFSTAQILHVIYSEATCVITYIHTSYASRMHACIHSFTHYFVYTSIHMDTLTW